MPRTQVIRLRSRAVVEWFHQLSDDTQAGLIVVTIGSLTNAACASWAATWCCGA